MVKVELGFYGVANYIQYVKGYEPSEAVALADYIEDCTWDNINIDDWLDNNDIRIFSSEEKLAEDIDIKNGIEHNEPYHTTNGKIIVIIY